MTKPTDDLSDRLRALRVDPPDGGFGLSLHRRLAEARPEAGPIDKPTLWRRVWPRLGPSHWQGGERLLWPAAGLAAGVATFFALAQLRDPRPALPQSALVAVRVPATKVAMVRVNLSAEVAVASAQIKVSLPDGLVFWADGEELPQRAFEWTQPLGAGDNEVPIAVRGLKAGHYKMTVTAQIGSQRIEDEVLLEVTNG